MKKSHLIFLNRGCPTTLLNPTDESSRPFTIDIFGEDLNGEAIAFPENTDVIILGPSDPNFETIDADNANIHRNRGTGFYFKPAGANDDDRFAAFTAGDFIDSQGFSIVANNSYFAPIDILTAAPVEGASLILDSNSRLVYTAIGVILIRLSC